MSMESTKTLANRAVGGGLEFTIDNHWRAKGASLYIDYGTDNFFDAVTACRGCSTHQIIKHRKYIYKVGVNYSF